jgi:hypothetical protein
MTVTADDSRIPYDGNGVTVEFNGPRVLLSTDLKVYLVDADGVSTLQVANTDYTLTRVGLSPSTVTMVVPPAVGETLVLVRDVPYTQPTSIKNQAAYLPEVIENALDRIVMMILQLINGIGLTRVLALYVEDEDGAGRYNGRGNRITGIADGIAADDAATVGQVSAGSGAFLAAGTGAVARTLQAKNREVMSVLDFGAVGDGVADDTAALVLAFAAASEYGAKLLFPDGTYMVSHIDETYTANLDVEMSPGATIKGFVSYQHYAGTGAAMVATITDFDYYDLGINVAINDGSAQTELVEGVDYTRAGNVVTTTVVVPIGQELQVSSTEPMLMLRASPVGVGIATPTIAWRGGKLDCSERGYSQSNASGTALNLRFWRAPVINGVTFYSGETWATTVGSGIGGDSGLTMVQCVGGSVSGCFFQGLADLGIYNTGGNNDAVSTDDGGGLFVYGNTFYRCSTGVKSIRQSRCTVISGNEFFECMTGVLGGAVAGPIGAGYDHIINGNVFKRMARRCIDLREMPSGATITNNRFIDWGRLPDGTVSSFGLQQAAVAVTGCPRTLVANNHFEFRDWSGVDFIGVRVNTSTVVVITPTAVTVRGNTFIGVEQAVLESGGSQVGCRYTENRMISVTTPYTIESASSVWDYIEEDGDKLGGIGNVAAVADAFTYTPALTNVANVASSTIFDLKVQRIAGSRWGRVTGKVAVACTANSVNTEFQLSLPVAADLTDETDVMGTAAPKDVATGGAAFAIYGDVATNRAVFRYVAGSSAVPSRTWVFSFLCPLW